MVDLLKRLLDHLEHSLDPTEQAAVHQRHARALRFESVDRLPIIMQYPAPADVEFRPFPYREAFRDPEKMLYNELVHAFDTSICHHALVGDDLPFTIRANCGTIIIASLFGGQWEQHNDDPPWARPYTNCDALQAVFDIDPLDFTRGICPKVVEVYGFYHNALADYPNLRQCVNIVLPDLQGPFDNAELLRGSEIYVDLYECPDIVRQLMERMVQAQAGFALHLKSMIREAFEGFCHQHATVLPGNILIRDDTAINVSPDMYREHIAPHDEAVLNQLGGGAIHFCGKGEHLVPEILRLPSLKAIDLGQPDKNNLDTIYKQTAARRIPIIRLRVSEQDLLSGQAARQFPTGVSLFHATGSIQDVGNLMATINQGRQ